MRRRVSCPGYAPNGRLIAHARSRLHVHSTYMCRIANNNLLDNPTLLKRPVFLSRFKSKAELLLLLLQQVTSVLNLAANLSGLMGERARTEPL